MQTFRILGTKVDSITVVDLHKRISEYIERGEKAIIANVNVQALNLSYSNYWFREFLNNSAIVFCDGAGVILAARILGHYIPERITYADWMWALAKYCEIQNYSLFFLGSKELIAQKAANQLHQKYPELRIVGVHHGYFNKTVESNENESVINIINNVKPDILVVGFGMPLQEQWILENWNKLHVKIGFTGGAVFDYISGELKRGPKWMTNHGLEWLARLIIEPRRLWKRYLLGNPIFFWRILKQKLGFSKNSNF